MINKEWTRTTSFSNLASDYECKISFTCDEKFVNEEICDDINKELLKVAEKISVECIEYREEFQDKENLKQKMKDSLNYELFYKTWSIERRTKSKENFIADNWDVLKSLSPNITRNANDLELYQCYLTHLEIAKDSGLIDKDFKGL